MIANSYRNPEATLEAMCRALAARQRTGLRVIARSPLTGETRSADPRDYPAMGPGDVLRDSEGEPMLLVVAGQTGEG